MMHSSFESEEQMLARIEAEERARMDFEDDSHLAATGELQPAAEETEAQMRARIEKEERARLDDSPDVHGRDRVSNCCRSATAMQLGPNAELLQLARRFCVLGLSAWGSSSDQLAQLRAEHWAALDGRKLPNWITSANTCLGVRARGRARRSCWAYALALLWKAGWRPASMT